MKCLMCGKNIEEEGELFEILFYEDCICYACRKKWTPCTKWSSIENIPVKSSYEYNDAFRSALIQYKECYDEALKDVFLYKEKKKIKKYLKGYTLLLMPSTEEKKKERGFLHLFKMYNCLNLPILDPFLTSQNQKGKSLEERKKILKEVHLKRNIHLPYKIALVDDVYTTGSTIRAALKCIDKKEHKIKIYTVARVPFLESNAYYKV